MEHLLLRAAVYERRDPDAKAGWGDLWRGFPLAARMGEFISTWARLSRREGRALTASDYIRLSGEPDRTVWRWLREFRELFPELGPEATPQRLVRALPAETEDVNAIVLADFAALPS